MYFHIIGIKERLGKQYELDLLLSGGDEDFIRDFLSHWGVVIVSMEEFKEDIESFWNISAICMFKDKEIQILMQGEDLSERIYFVIYLGLKPKFVNFVKNPISEVDMFKIIQDTIDKIDELNEEIQRKKDEEELKEQKKYEESAVKEGLKVINHNIKHMEQLIKACEGAAVGSDIVKTENIINEMKKIRLGTNFNKMALMVLEAHRLTHHLEKDLFEAYDSQKFIIEKNSCVTNVDVFYENSVYNKIKDKMTMMPKMLTTTESILGALGTVGIYLPLLKRDFISTFEQTSFDEFFKVLMNLCEYFVLTGTIVITISWLIAPMLGFDGFTLYLLPACGWLGLLLFLFNSLHLNGVIISLSGFIVLAIIYWEGLMLLLNTFAI